MKRILFLSLCLFSFAAVNAQSSSSKVVVRTTAYKLFDYGRTATVTTTDATVTPIDIIPIASDEAGIVEVQCVGFNDSTNTAVTGSLIVRYVKAGGTLTLGTASTPLATLVDTELSGSTFAAAVVSNNIAIRVTGKVGYTISWKANIRKTTVNP